MPQPLGLYNSLTNQDKRKQNREAVKEGSGFGLEAPNWEQKKTQYKAEYDPKEPLLSIFGRAEKQPTPEYDEKRQKTRKKQAVLSGLGAMLTNVGDSVTLGMGGHVVKRDKPKTDQYIDDFLSYRDDYNKRMDKFNYQKMNELIGISGKMSDVESREKAFDFSVDSQDWKSKTDVERLKQYDENAEVQNDLAGQRLELTDKQHVESLTERKRATIENEKDRDSDRWEGARKFNEAQKLREGEYKEKYTDELVWKDADGNEQLINGREEFKQAKTDALNDSEFWKNSDFFERYNDYETDPITGIKIPVEKYKMKDAVTSNDLVRGHKEYRSTKRKEMIRENRKTVENWKKEQRAQGKPGLSENKLTENDYNSLRSLVPSILQGDEGARKYMYESLIDKGYDDDDAAMYAAQIIFDYTTSQQQ